MQRGSERRIVAKLGIADHCREGKPRRAHLPQEHQGQLLFRLEQEAPSPFPHFVDVRPRYADDLTRTRESFNVVF